MGLLGQERSRPAGSGPSDKAAGDDPAPEGVRPRRAHLWTDTAAAVWRKYRRPAALLIAVLFIEFGYLFLVSAGKYVDFPTYNVAYQLQADGFRKGHLYIALEPAPELVAAENPLDPANGGYWAADFSFFKGKYYMYWGPFPAVALLIVERLFRIKEKLGDQYPTFAFYSIYLGAGALLLDRLSRRLFPGTPLYMVLGALLAFAFASPTPYLVATPGIYEAAIGGCQAFLLVGLLFALAGQQHGLPARFRLAGAGAAWAIAVSCRVSSAPAIALLALTSAFITDDARCRWKERATRLLWIGMPLALAVGMLLLFNKRRFDAWLEFGNSFQLNTVHFRASLDFVGPNLYSYFLRPPVVSCTFPFVTAPWDMGAAAFPPVYQLPLEYPVQEPVVGMLLAAPWLWLAPLAFGFALYRALPRQWVRAPSTTLRVARGSLLWCLSAFAILAVVNAVPIIGAAGATMRYLGDASAGLMLFTTWGVWSAYRALRGHRWLQHSLGAVTTVLAAATVILGLLFGYQGYMGQFQSFNPDLHERVVKKYSRCP